MEESLRPEVQLPDASAILQALSVPELFRELVQGAAWSAERYQASLTDLLVDQLM